MCERERECVREKSLYGSEGEREERDFTWMCVREKVCMGVRE